VVLLHVAVLYTFLYTFLYTLYSISVIVRGNLITIIDSQAEETLHHLVQKNSKTRDTHTNTDETGPRITGNTSDETQQAQRSTPIVLEGTLITERSRLTIPAKVKILISHATTHFRQENHTRVITMEERSTATLPSPIQQTRIS
jgi:hypothetical protein